MLTSDDIKKYCRSIDIDLVGVTDAQPFSRWRREMDLALKNGWVSVPPSLLPNDDDSMEAWSDPRRSLPSARSIIVIGIRYLSPVPGVKGGEDGGGKVAREHWYDFYPNLDGKKELLIEYLKGNGVVAIDVKLPVKAAAHRSGVGVYGKNTNIQNEDFGSWLLFRTVVTDLELSLDEGSEPRCGACQRCLRLCPTKAIKEPYVLDSSRCLSTILSSPGPVPYEQREAVGMRILGCDLCQEVCPRNESVPPLSGMEDRFVVGMGDDVDLRWVANASSGELRGLLARSGNPSLDPDLLRRNAMIAMGNSGDISFIETLEGSLSDQRPLVRGHAAWALAILGSEDSIPILSAMVGAETDPQVRDEMEWALSRMMENRTDV
jgi:epoxyqueuosine reductase